MSWRETRFANSRSLGLLWPALSAPRNPIGARLIQRGLNQEAGRAVLQLVSQDKRRFQVLDHPVALAFELGHAVLAEQSR